MKGNRVHAASLLIFIVALTFSKQTLLAQRIYDGFDAPTINQNAPYRDISVDPAALIDRYNGPFQLADMPYQELPGRFPDRVIFADPTNLDDDYFQVPLPFNIQFDNNAYPAGSNLWVSTNGFVIITATQLI